jgi:hypothetical protein
MEVFMSLTRKQKMTAKNLAAKRGNGRKSRGAVTRAGKAKSAAARLVHGFYSQAGSEAMIALGEDPKKYAALLQSVAGDLQPRAGLESEVVGQIVRTLWRIRRAEQMQDGLAMKRLRSGMQTDQLVNAPRLLRIHDIYEPLCDIGRMLNRPDSTPLPGEIEALVNAFGATPPDDVRKIFPLLRSYGEAAAKAPGPVKENGGTPSTPEGQEREAARERLGAALHDTMLPYRRALDSLMEESETNHSPENMAALMAPRDENSLLMQRMEDSNLRRLWRLTRIYLMIKSPADEAEVDESNL